MGLRTQERGTRTMARTESVQSGGIAFGRWKPRPLDDRNWELCERRDGKWRPMGRYYQYNTFPLAIQYAADCALKEKAHGEQMALQDALHEYAKIVDALKSDVLAALDGDAR